MVSTRDANDGAGRGAGMTEAALVRHLRHRLPELDGGPGLWCATVGDLRAALLAESPERLLERLHWLAEMWNPMVLTAEIEKPKLVGGLPVFPDSFSFRFFSLL